MPLAFGIILILFVPLILASGGFGPPTAEGRRLMLGGCTVIAAIAFILWLLGMDTLPLVVLAYAPAYQIVLCALVMKRFRSLYGREMQLIGFGTVTDEENKKDGRYSTAYFMAALIFPLTLLGVFVA